MLNPKLLEIICCPETHQKLETAGTEMIQDLNARIASGQLRNVAGATVQEKLDGGLIRADKKLLFPVRQEIPVMLMDEAIPLN